MKIRAAFKYDPIINYCLLWENPHEKISRNTLNVKIFASQSCLNLTPKYDLQHIALLKIRDDNVVMSPKSS